MEKSKPESWVFSEEKLASVMVPGEKLSSAQIMIALNLQNGITIYQVTGVLRKMHDAGFLSLHRRSNRPHLWSLARKPIIRSRHGDKSRVCGVEIERVSVGGSQSNHHRSSLEKPTIVSLPKMPQLRSAEASA